MPFRTGSRTRGHACCCITIDPVTVTAANFRVMSTSPDTPDPKAPNAVAQFEQSLDELETLVQRMEKGDLSLDESLAAYERGVGLYRRCQTALEQAELRVRLLADPLDPENSEPFDDAD